MDEENKKLAALLNDESFLAWIRGYSTPEETQKWQKWRLKSTDNQTLIRKARKIESMPFSTQDVPTDEVRDGLRRFENNFLRLIKHKENNSDPDEKDH